MGKNLLLYQKEQHSDPSRPSGICYLPFFTTSSKPRHLINNNYYERNFILGFFNHLVQLHQFTVQELEVEITNYCNNTHIRNPVDGFDHLSSIDLYCAIRILKNLPGFSFMKQLSKKADRIITVEALHHQDQDFSGIYFIDDNVKSAMQIDYIFPTDPFIKSFQIKNSSRERIVLINETNKPDIELHILFPSLE